MQYQKEDVRKRIVDAAKTEFLRVGFYRASMLQISNKARVPIGNLYRYFASKSALFDAIVGTAKERIVLGIENLNSLGYEGDVLSEKSMTVMAEKVSDSLADIARDYQKELVLLLQKSGGSEHDGFIEYCTALVKELLIKRLKEKNYKNNEFLFEIIADNITRGIFRIMIECPLEEQQKELGRLLVFYFNHFEDRL